ncbi:MAG: hypothetical protein WA461_15280, partial [Nitrososphaeraceae archaeon]
MLTLGVVVSSIGLIQTHPLDLRASNDGESEAVDLLNQNRLIEFDDIVNLTNNNEDSVYGQVSSSNNNTYVVWQESVPGNTDRN